MKLTHDYYVATKKKEIKLLEIFDTIISVLQSNENTEEKIKNKIIKRARCISNLKHKLTYLSKHIYIPTTKCYTYLKSPLGKVTF